MRRAPFAVLAVVKHAAGAPHPASAPTRLRPVRSIGRDSKRHYCERCGQKRRACRCP